MHSLVLAIKLVRRAIWLVLFSFSLQSLIAQENNEINSEILKNPGGYFFRDYISSQGFDIGIRCITQDHRSRLIVGNYEKGIVIFDGKNWLPIEGTEFVTELKFHPTSKKTFVAAHSAFGYLEENEEGFYKFQLLGRMSGINEVELQKEIKAVIEEDRHPISTSAITKIEFLAEDDILFYSNKEIFRCKGKVEPGSIIKIERPKEATEYYGFFYHANTLIINTDGGLFKLDGNLLVKTAMDIEQVPIEKDLEIEELYDKRYYRPKPKENTNVDSLPPPFDFTKGLFTAYSVLPTNQFQTLINCQYNDDTGIRLRLFIFDGKTLKEVKQKLAKQCGSPNLFLHKIINWDTLIFAASIEDGCLILKYDKSKNQITAIRTLDYESGLPSDRIYNLFSDNSGGAWLAHRAGLTRAFVSFPLFNLSVYDKLSGKPRAAIRFQGNTYVGTTAGLFYLGKVKEKKAVDTIEQKSVGYYTTYNTTKVTTPVKTSPTEKKSTFGKFFQKVSNTFSGNKSSTNNKNTLTYNQSYQTNRRYNRYTQVKRFIIKRKDVNLRVQELEYQPIQNIDGAVISLTEYRKKLYALTTSGVFIVQGISAERITPDSITVTCIQPDMNTDKIYVGCQNEVGEIVNGQYTRTLAPNDFVSVNNIAAGVNGPILGTSKARVSFLKKTTISTNKERIETNVLEAGPTIPGNHGPVQVYNIFGKIRFLADNGFWIWSGDTNLVPDKLLNRFLEKGKPFMFYEHQIQKGTNYLYIISKGNIFLIKMIGGKEPEYNDSAKIEMLCPLLVNEEVYSLYAADAESEKQLYTDLYITTENHVLRLNVEQLKSESFLKNVNRKLKPYISQIEYKVTTQEPIIKIAPLEKQPKINLLPEGNKIRFIVSVPFFEKPEGIMYRYRISTDIPWDSIPWTFENEFFKEDIPSGNYLLEVQVRDPFGKESVPLQYEFTVSSPWYWPIRIGGALLTIAVLFFAGDSYAKYRTRALEEKHKIEKQKLEEEKQRAEEREKLANAEKEKAQLLAREEEARAQAEHSAREAAEARALAEQEARKAEEARHKVLEEQQRAVIGSIATTLHNLNTPLGAVKGSVENVKVQLPKALEVYRKADDSSASAMEVFIQRVIGDLPVISTKEERQFRKKIEAELSQKGVKQAETAAEILVRMRLLDNLDPLLPILQSDNVKEKLKEIQVVTGLYTETNRGINSLETTMDLLNDLKDIDSALRDGSFELTDKISITENINKVLEKNKNLLTGVSIKKQGFDLEIPPIKASGERLEKLWHNLIVNAVKAMRQNDNPSELSVSINSVNQHIIVTIEDNGTGIPEEIISEIFKPFFTTGRAGESAGLGLFIANWIVKNHGGSFLPIETEKDKFTRIAVDLPINT